MRRLLSFAVLAMAVAPLAGAGAVSCYTPTEATAVQVRMLQSELMVAALACRDSNPEYGMVAQYNEFVHRLGDRLIRHSKVLQAHFRKLYGVQSTHHLDEFITEIANDASKRSMTSGYCDSAAGMFRQASSLPQSDLERFAAARAADAGMPVKTCTADTAGELAKR